MNKKIELLAPAGNQACFDAALLAGADAIYMGVGSMNARASATNFTIEQAKICIKQAHLLDVKVYITMNTLVLDREMEEQLALAEELVRIGADAFIIQDMGLAREIKKQWPQMALHASTQMSIHNAEGVLAAQEMGFARAVLARELSLAEINEIAKKTTAELEVFVHGAMCVSVSGQCLHSSFLGGRSGNRGQCAQPCRLKYTAPNGELAHWLSMKDLCLLEQIDQLVGVISLKIEGRMKSPTYVANVVQAYRKALDGAIVDQKKEKEHLAQVFNRGGFSMGYPSAVVDATYNGHRGIPVGTYHKKGSEIDKPLREGDRICTQFGLDEMRVSNDCFAGKQFFSFKGAKEGATIWRLRSEEMEEETQRYLHETKRSIPIEMKIIAKENRPIELFLSSKGKNVHCTGAVIERAEKTGLTKERIEQAMGKLGDTCFYVQTMVVELENDHLFLPSRSLNELRRRGTDELEKVLTANANHSMIKPYKLEKQKNKHIAENRPAIVAQCITIAQAEAAIQAGADIIYAQPRIWNREAIEKWVQWAKNHPCFLSFPPIILEKNVNYVRLILENINTKHFQGAVCGHIGIKKAYENYFENWHSDFTWNIVNQYAEQEAEEQGIAQVTLSVEATLPQMRDIIKKATKAEIVVYGTLPSMNLVYCPLREANKGNCVADCEKGKQLIDRKQEKWTVLPFTFQRGNCLIQLLNAHCLDGQKYSEGLRACQADAWRLAFYNEEPEEIAKYVQQYVSLRAGGQATMNEKMSGGHFSRGF